MIKKWVKSPVSLRRGHDHVATRLQLRDERAHAYLLTRGLSVIFIAFSYVDWISTGRKAFLPFLFLRLGTVVLSRAINLITRGRMKYGTRHFLSVGPYIFSVEYIMLANGLMATPYVAGLALVLMTVAALFPARREVAAVNHAIYVLPVVFHVMLRAQPADFHLINALAMCLGAALLSAFNAARAWAEFRERIRLSELLTRDLGSREREIREKAGELLRRQTFESQFSPQIVTAVLEGGPQAVEMRQQKIAVVVIDIVNSTMKSKELDPSTYKEVVEEVFDLFSSACLQRNVTVDKFTGDGAQAFSGAPVAALDDFERAVLACKDLLQALGSRASDLASRWRGPLGVRLAVCGGHALVGFLGRGTLKSFTAIGETVSFAHRLCGASEPGTIAAFPASEARNLSTRTATVRNLKGFGTQEFEVAVL